MTVLVTVEGDLLQADPDSPKQTTASGRETLARGSFPFTSSVISGSLTLIDGRPVSFADIYRTQPWVGAMVNKLVRQIARLPLKVYKRDNNGERQRIYSHRLIDLLNNPAPGVGASQLKQWFAMPTLIHGNGVVLKYRHEKAGPPTRLWPLDWRHLQPQLKRGTDAIGSPIEFWRTSEFGRPVDLDPFDVAHTSWAAPDGPLGVSPLQQLGTTVRVESSAQDYQESYLRQGARPPSAVKLPDGVVLDKETRAEMRADITEAYAGAKNAGRPALLPGGVDWVTIAHNAHEAELIEQRHLTREEICGIYDIPPPMVGILDKATYSNVTEQHRMLFTTVLGPWLSLIETTIMRQIVDPEPAFAGLFVEFDLAEVLKGDKLKEMNALKLGVQSGLLTINEARRIQNLPAFDLKWCDQPLIPVNNLASSPPEGNGNGQARIGIGNSAN